MEISLAPCSHLSNRICMCLRGFFFFFFLLSLCAQVWEPYIYNVYIKVLFPQFQQTSKQTNKRALCLPSISTIADWPPFPASLDLCASCLQAQVGKFYFCCGTRELVNLADIRISHNSSKTLVNILTRVKWNSLWLLSSSVLYKQFFVFLSKTSL